MAERDRFGRIPAKIIEVDQPLCSLTYGEAPCQAELGVTGETKCFNTFATCQDTENIDLSETLTLRFSEVGQTGIPQDLLPIPLVKDVRQKPSRLSVGGVNEDVSPLGSRATLNVSLQDAPYSDIQTDPYLDEREYDPLSQGTFWGKWKARNDNRRGIPVRYRSGYLALDGTFEDHQTYSYIMEKVDGPDGQGNVSIKCFDLIQSLKSDRAVYPATSGGRLANDISDSATSFALVPVGIGDDEYPSSFRCRIGGEGFDVTRSGDSCTITQRGLYGGNESHEADDTVQVVAQFNAEQIQDIAYDIITGAIPDLASNIPKSKWDGVAASFLPRNYSADITEPTGVEDLLTELIQTAPFFLYVDIRTNLIELEAIRQPDQVGISIGEENDVLAGTQDVKEYPKERIDEVWVYYRIRDPAGSIDEPENYSQRFILVNPEEQQRRNSRSIRRIFTRWIEAGARDTAEEIAQGIISRFQELPIRYSFDLDAKSADIWLGDVVKPNTRLLQTPTGENRTDINYQVIEAQEADNGSVYRYVAQSYEFIQPVDPDTITISIEPEDTVDANGNVESINLRTLYDNVVASEIDEITFVVLGGPSQTGGTVVGDDFDNAPSLTLPDDFPWNPTIFMRIEEGGAVLGKGGNFAGSSQGHGDDFDTFSGFVDGTDGQTAFFCRYNVTVSNFGIIGGGGGGGGGGGYATATYSSTVGNLNFNAGGGGGGGGAGRTFGVGGDGGEMDEPNESNVDGSDGGQATFVSGAAGGSGGSFSGDGDPVRSGDGGAGGDLGQAGQSGSPGQINDPPDGATLQSSDTTSGGAGGAAGAAIDGVSYVTFTFKGDVRGSEIN